MTVGLVKYPYKEAPLTTFGVIIVANKVCSACGHSCGPRNFFCTYCEEPFKKTIAKSKTIHSYVPLAAPVPHVATQPRTVVCNTAGPTLKPNAFADEGGILNLDPGSEFDDLYGKTDALSVVMASLRVFNQTGGRSRQHTLLIGSPAAGKSEILLRLSNVIGEENIMKINAESASKAGMENTILFYEGNLPPVLFLEEIEKTPHADSLLWTLPALDNRRKIIKVTAKDGIIPREVPFICIGTCNDIHKLNKFHSGSIASRFPNQLFIPDMDDNMRWNILKGKIKCLPNANDAWINPAIDYCRSVGNMSMRKIESVLMCGQDRLLTGEYQASLEATQKV